MRFASLPSFPWDFNPVSCGLKSKVTINDIPFEHAEATAKDKDSGEDVEVSVAFFTPAENEVYILMFLGTKDAMDSHGDNLTKVIQSIRKKD